MVKAPGGQQAEGGEEVVKLPPSHYSQHVLLLGGCCNDGNSGESEKNRFKCSLKMQNVICAKLFILKKKTKLES